VKVVAAQLLFDEERKEEEKGRRDFGGAVRI